MLRCHAESCGRREEQLRIRFGALDLVAGDDPDVIGQAKYVNAEAAVAMVPLVAMAYGTPRRLNCFTSSRAPGSGRPVPVRLRYAASCS